MLAPPIVFDPALLAFCRRIVAFCVHNVLDVLAVRPLPCSEKMLPRVMSGI